MKLEESRPFEGQGVHVRAVQAVVDDVKEGRSVGCTIG